MKQNHIIHLQGMEFYAFHGVLEEEKKLGQRFLVDVDLYLPPRTAGTDNIKDTVNYAEVFILVKDCVEQERFSLLESLADKILMRLRESFTCQKIRVVVHKPQAPIQGIIKDVSLEAWWEK